MMTGVWPANITAGRDPRKFRQAPPGLPQSNAIAATLLHFWDGNAVLDDLPLQLHGCLMGGLPAETRCADCTGGSMADEAE
ncbi:hypothetical protein NDU88_008553 [Pleurodeles waltl]|uniref:Uncharacterized protein n=1 Tax=Pleurodeles waltl TaxID=8319 RepID=A0AAV7QS47_PLEWA|nr:hypothetical protein NDU88_008553 [Pleurodeles waltl]